MNSEFKSLFWNLNNKPYEAHWFTHLTKEQVLKGEPSDCSDRTSVLCEWCDSNGLEYKLVWTLLKTPLSLHVCLMCEGYVYDPIWGAYEVPLNDYNKLLQGWVSKVTSGWINRIIKVI